MTPEATTTLLTIIFSVLGTVSLVIALQIIGIALSNTRKAQKVVEKVTEVRKCCNKKGRCNCPNCPNYDWGF